MARLIVTEGPDHGVEFELVRPGEGQVEELTIGRDPRVTLPLGDSAVSREHCRIDAMRRGFRLVDLGSRNRTYLNDDPVDKAWLQDGDVLVIGDSELRFEDDSISVDGDQVASTIIKEVADGGPAHSGLIEGVPQLRDSIGQRAVNGSAVADPSDSDRMRAAIVDLERTLAVVREIADTTTPRDLFLRFFTELLPVLDAERAAFLHRKGKQWKIAASAERDSAGRDSGKSETDAGRARPALDVVEAAAEGRKTIQCSRGLGDEDPASLEATRYCLATPLLARGRVLGVVWIERSTPHPAFDERSLHLLRAAVEPVGPVLERLEERASLVEENRNLLRSISQTRRIVGDSDAIRDVLEFIQRAAPTPMTVLIQGETGTGKELVASAIHYGSSRRGGPFVAINCAALPENLVESELFGHERGAFTGAVARKKGRFELAAGGTVFLDEVGELTLACQAKLLRLLEERRFERVGGVDSVEADVRIIAATNRDLLEMVERKEFREDLFYRLDVLAVRVPPLRERPDDVPLLVQHFVALQAAAGRPKKLSKSAEKKLRAYSWPGNVRQLRNVIESAIVLGSGLEIGPEDLVLPAKRSEPIADTGDAWRPISLQELEHMHIGRVLEHTGGNKKRAAELLGIERCTLYSKLKKASGKEEA